MKKLTKGISSPKRKAQYDASDIEQEDYQVHILSAIIIRLERIVMLSVLF